MLNRWLTEKTAHRGGKGAKRLVENEKQLWGARGGHRGGPLGKTFGPRGAATGVGPSENLVEIWRAAFEETKKK